MKIQSLSICVPGGCFNKCKFCVSQIHPNQAPDLIEKEFEFADLHYDDYKDCMEFARDNGCNTMMYTGDGEPTMNRHFMEMVASMNETLSAPFRWIELQPAGYKLQEIKDGTRNAYLRWLRNKIRVKVISLSLSDVFSSDNNAFYNNTPAGLLVDIDKTCAEIKRYDFTLRLSLNMTDFYNQRSAVEIFDRAHQLGANQITFRKLYQTSGEDETNKFITEHSCSDFVMEDIKKFVTAYGRELEMLPFGAMKYSVGGISTVLDMDCMSTETKNELKYLVLRQNCKLYSKWDDMGSVLF